MDVLRPVDEHTKESIMPYHYGYSDKAYMPPANDGALKKAMEQHQRHHYPESYLDGKTVPISIMDEKHKGRR